MVTFGVRQSPFSAARQALATILAREALTAAKNGASAVFRQDNLVREQRGQAEARSRKTVAGGGD